MRARGFTSSLKKKLLTISFIKKMQPNQESKPSEKQSMCGVEIMQTVSLFECFRSTPYSYSYVRTRYVLAVTCAAEEIWVKWYVVWLGCRGKVDTEHVSQFLLFYLHKDQTSGQKISGHKRSSAAASHRMLYPDCCIKL